ncbi:hypothetical protein C8N29_103136 [Agitococcus lubricus]|uniref:Uncharacterized protein n=1 Tax=Agitococcus lubricus TaxID=1077255 RepID=A0A2T5J213_9GAMM|nr:hypothetical protein C8N29_103136 [Agitococcus lubricus]
MAHQWPAKQYVWAKNKFWALVVMRLDAVANRHAELLKNSFQSVHNIEVSGVFTA